MIRALIQLAVSVFLLWLTIGILLNVAYIVMWLLFTPHKF